MKSLTPVFLVLLLAAVSCSPQPEPLTIQKGDYLGTRGFDVIFFNNNYAEGHQGGIELIIHDDRIATNGDIRLEPSPGQWAPVPKLLSREAITETGMLSARLVYPDSSKNAKGFNPIYYPDLHLFYTINIEPGEDASVIVTVDFEMNPYLTNGSEKSDSTWNYFQKNYSARDFIWMIPPGLFPANLLVK